MNNNKPSVEAESKSYFRLINAILLYLIKYVKGPVKYFYVFLINNLRKAYFKLRIGRYEKISNDIDNNINDDNK